VAEILIEAVAHIYVSNAVKATHIGLIGVPERN
jgi:hypothetical protein